jgi:hypothetical protein
MPTSSRIHYGSVPRNFMISGSFIQIGVCIKSVRRPIDQIFNRRHLRCYVFEIAQFMTRRLMSFVCKMPAIMMDCFSRVGFPQFLDLIDNLLLRLILPIG